MLIGCGWTGGKGSWPDHLRRQCPEVEDDNNPERQARAGSVPLAVREEAAAAAAAAQGARPRDGSTGEREEVAEIDENDFEAAIFHLNDKRVGGICVSCDSEIFNYGFMCTSSNL